jgi:hypothetical protein
MEHNIRIFAKFVKIVFYLKSKNSCLKQIYSKTVTQEQTNVKTDTQKQTNAKQIRKNKQA